MERRSRRRWLRRRSPVRCSLAAPPKQLLTAWLLVSAGSPGTLPPPAEGFTPVGSGINAAPSPEELARAAALPQLPARGAAADSDGAAAASAPGEPTGAASAAASAAADSPAQVAMAAGDWGDGQTFPELNELAAAVDDILQSSTGGHQHCVTAGDSHRAGGHDR